MTSDSRTAPRYAPAERRLRFRRLAGVATVLSLCLLIGVPTAAAQTSTAQFQGSYRAYNVFDAWKWWQPDKCTQTQPIYGSEPSLPGRFPVLLYMHSAGASVNGNVEGQRVVELAASQGFVAATFQYGLVAWGRADESIDGHAKCMFSADSPGNALTQVCARPKADCSRGVVVAGFSGGGAIAGRAKNFAPAVRAAWLMGVSGPATASALAVPSGTRALSNDRLRINVGRSDVEVRDPITGQVSGIDVTALNQMTGQSCSGPSCLRADGSGYYVVGHSEVADGFADHCYWHKVSRLGLTGKNSSCTLTPTFDPGFAPPSATPWSLITSLEWLRARLG